MSLGRIFKTFPSLPLTDVVVKDSRGSPARLYWDKAGTGLISINGQTRTSATGVLDVWVSDSHTYTLELVSNGVVLERTYGVDADAGNSPASVPEDGKVGRVLRASGVPVSVPAITTEYTMATVRVPGSVLALGGRVVVECDFSFTGSTNAKTMRVKAGNILLGNQVRNASGQQTERMIVSARVPGAATALIAAGAGNTTFGVSSQTAVVAGVNTAADFDVTITGQKATAGETLTLYSYVVRIEPGEVQAIDAVCWGDSLTAGTGASAAFAQYPNDLAEAYEHRRVAYNQGVGGQTSTQIAARFAAGTVSRAGIQVIWAGINNYASGATVLSDIASMVGTIGHSRYLVLSLINGEYTTEYLGGAGYEQIMAINAALAGAYPSNYLDVRAPLIAANTGTGQDAIDAPRDIVPASVRSDARHLNDAGYLIVATAVKAAIDARGW